MPFPPKKQPLSPLGIANLMGEAAHKKEKNKSGFAAKKKAHKASKFEKEEEGTPLEEKADKKFGEQE